MTRYKSCWLLLGTFAVACTQDVQPYSEKMDTSAAMVGIANDCSAAPESYEEVAIFARCVGCHSSAKTGAERSAPTDVNFDSAEAAEASAFKAVGAVRIDLMPPGSAARPTQAEKQELYDWVRCRL